MSKAYFDTIDATWPPLNIIERGGFLLRDGGGSDSKRVCCATLNTSLSAADIQEAETGMLALNQTPLFMIREEDNELDAKLNERDYDIVDPVHILSAPVSTLIRELEPLACFEVFPPLAIMEEIWAEGGITEGRLNVMHRAQTAKTTLLGRAKGRAAGAAFVGLHGKIAMLHALEVSSRARRQGVAVNMMYAAANWSQDHGAEQLSVVVTHANTAANKLYTFLNMKPVGHYHYRIKQKNSRID
ncbi:GNAT family N-acetyltransferase [Halocynthiibacter sp. C4]|uniref:GNAT family N-acetyltransferase n=1 Tax=Halocynthiibacter sp. C4 TaxID=2992758 RepID=UPI00237B28A9|nr:GNAT family N-acetyltransferase [Halocynthiibacter sp. C4]MDE0588392.1 GNAT family N-acetyltransferase [Halocynthiibacter sp. C4]